VNWETFRRRAFFVGLLAAVVVVVYGDSIFGAEQYPYDLCTAEPANSYWAWIKSWFC
jgi:hypothetical protein